MIFGRIENSDKHAHNAVCFMSVGQCVAVGIGQERPGQIANGGYDDSKIITAVPEAVVGCLVSEDLATL